MRRQALTGSRVRDRRLLLGLKQSDLARMVGISSAYLNLIEHNRRRVGAELLESLARALKVEPATLAEGAEGAIFDALREAAAAPEPGIRPEIETVEDFASRFPGWAALLAARQGQVARLSRTVESLSERMAQDPFLAASLHEVLSAITAVRSTSAILAETEDIEPEWRTRFHRNIHEDSLRLTSVSTALVSWLDQAQAPEAGLASPQEELESWLLARGHHFPQLERATAASAESIIAGAPELASDAARKLALSHLAIYRADAQALPVGTMQKALAEVGPDPLKLSQVLGVPMARILRRMAGLPDELVPPGLGLVACDATGTLTFRRAAAGFSLPRFGAACALWPLYEALVQPGMPVRRVLETSGRGAGARFIAYAWCDRTWPAGFDGPGVSQALMLILPLTAEAESRGRLAEVPRIVGTSCRICSEAGCVARREPSILA